MKALAEQIGDIDGVNIYGRVVGVRGLMVEVAGPIHAMSVGCKVSIETAPGRSIAGEVVGFSDNNALLMPFGALDGVRRGCRAIVSSSPASVSWLYYANRLYELPLAIVGIAIMPPTELIDTMCPARFSRMPGSTR